MCRILITVVDISIRVRNYSDYKEDGATEIIVVDISIRARNKANCKEDGETENKE